MKKEKKNWTKRNKCIEKEKKNVREEKKIIEKGINVIKKKKRREKTNFLNCGNKNRVECGIINEKCYLCD